MLRTRFRLDAIALICKTINSDQFSEGYSLILVTRVDILAAGRVSMNLNGLDLKLIVLAVVVILIVVCLDVRAKTQEDKRRPAAQIWARV